MPEYLNHPCRHRPLRPKEAHVTSVGLDRTEFQLLQMARWFFTSYSTSGTAWVRAFVEAEGFFGRTNGPRYAYGLLRVLQVIRRTRRSAFRFNNPSCPDCAVVLTEMERRLFQSLIDLRQGRVGRAQAEIMMLSEGNGFEHILIEIQQLVDLLPDRLEQNAQHSASEEATRYV